MRNYQTTVPKGGPAPSLEPKKSFPGCAELDKLYALAKHYNCNYLFEAGILIETTLIPTRIESCGMLFLLEASPREGMLTASLKVTRLNLDELSRQGLYIFDEKQLRVIGLLCTELLQMHRR